MYPYFVALAWCLRCRPSKLAPRWKWAGWALPHIMRLAHLAERCIQWLLNRPGIAELRQLDEEHYIAARRETERLNM